MQTVYHRSRHPLVVLACLSVAAAFDSPAQDVPKAVPMQNVSAIGSQKNDEKKGDLSATLLTQKEARTMRLSIPAPRGQIVDRNGVALATNRVVHYLALNFPFMPKATPEAILNYAKGKIAEANRLLGKNWSLPDDRLLSHYEHRRWLPLVFSIEEGLNVEITPEQQKLLASHLGQGLLLQPAYIRTYPKDDCACHIIGYTGKTRPLPQGPIADGDQLFEEMEGREGLEVTFDTWLKGLPGEINLLFDPDGKLLADEVLRRPSPGRTVVTTLDFNLQKYAENALKKSARNGGSMVIMDVRNGDILAMASNPGFNLNEFIPGIRSARWEELANDPKKPTLARAFRGEYPPASTFKIITALGALESGQVGPSTAFNCGTSFLVGDRYFNNWNTKSDEGPMNVITAIKRSCNTWFYQAALQAGADPITNMALRMGFGERTGIPLKAEAKGNVPTNADHKILGGELANISIGQGAVLVSPLQTCQAMAALADGVNMPQPRLVKQVQTIGEIVVDAAEPSVRRQVNLDPIARDTVIKGMVAVVSGSGGTGRAAGIKKAQIAGKTGTAQWRIPTDQNLAWFTGFLPASQPVLAFAVVYEGSPGETVSGGAVAAPIVNEVFTKYFEGAPTDDPLVNAMKDVPQAVPVDEGQMDGVAAAETARPAEAAPPPPPPEQKTLGGFFRRLFKRGP
ncbi:penicillin-binding protein 2 [Prosthecobacter debontii]|uniref:Penicillin-binding protein 2 n=1 Tax=Prosthecobacter debontii TaxID=48467 RepID=A0A1T4YZS0_9BACT|nr:penicillin-binding transpeptidase domain-containing protein [Prosthecobacter debontii]SKB06801.1 penicillin-binding protein 2 [Prosthecobacter debontii]